jgi:hypothetical protein
VKPSVRAGWIGVALFAAAAVYVGGTPFGGWLQSWLYGSGIRWQAAYRALDAEGPSGVTDIERRRLAWAHAEDEPPAGLGDTRRLHRPGTLARLRWKTFDVRCSRRGRCTRWCRGCPTSSRREVSRSVTRARASAR